MKLNEHVVDSLINEVFKSKEFQDLINLANTLYGGKASCGIKYSAAGGAGKGSINICIGDTYFYEMGRAGDCTRYIDGIRKTLLSIDKPVVNKGGHADYDLDRLETYYNESVQLIIQDVLQLKDETDRVIQKIEKMPSGCKRQTIKFALLDQHFYLYGRHIDAGNVKRLGNFHPIGLYKFLRKEINEWIYK